jgi:hypothetical protein
MAMFSLGSNSRVRGQAALELGWSPTQHSIVHWIANEMTAPARNGSGVRVI